MPLAVGSTLHDTESKVESCIMTQRFSGSFCSESVEALVRRRRPRYVAEQNCKSLILALKHSGLAARASFAKHFQVEGKSRRHLFVEPEKFIEESRSADFGPIGHASILTLFPKSKSR